MQTSENGIAAIKTREGFCPVIRPDNKGPMIGHGHDLTPAEIAAGAYADGITEPEADLLLRHDLAARFEPAVCRLAPGANQNQFDALASFTYNEGPAHLATMLHHGFDQVAARMPAWCYGEVNGVEQKMAGLVTRRASEVEQFNTPVS